MKLLRFGLAGRERPGLLDGAGAIRDLSDVVPDIAGEILSPDGVDRLSSINLSALPVVVGAPRLGPPVTQTRTFACIGLNYADHAAETGAKTPEEPIVFLKSLSALCGPYDDIVVPPKSTRTDWEGELAVVIGMKAQYVDRERAFDFVAGYTTCIDVSEREWQNDRGGSWDKGKGFETFGPIGPWLVTKDEIPDPQRLRIRLRVDGETMQDGSTSTMIFPVGELVSYVSHCFTLHPGDIITTGTPPGVGVGRRPPRFLVGGQTVCLTIDGLGEQTHRTVDFSAHQ
jgi:ureidoglycolate lyase